MRKREKKMERERGRERARKRRRERDRNLPCGVDAYAGSIAATFKSGYGTNVWNQVDEFVGKLT